MEAEIDIEDWAELCIRSKVHTVHTYIYVRGKRKDAGRGLVGHNLDSSSYIKR